MSKKLLIELRKQLRTEIANNSESADYQRGIRTAALILSDVLDEFDKNTLSEIMQQV